MDTAAVQNQMAVFAHSTNKQMLQYEQLLITHVIIVCIMTGHSN